MDMEKLPQFVILLVIVGMLLGVGILVLDKFSDSARESTTITNESFVMPVANKTVSLAQEDLTSFTKIMNSSGATLGSGNYSVVLSAGTVNNTGNAVGFLNGSTVYAYYVYDDYTSTPVTSIRSTRDAIAEISTSWLPLIIIVAILGLILGLVLASFGQRRK